MASRPGVAKILRVGSIPTSSNFFFRFESDNYRHQSICLKISYPLVCLVIFSAFRFAVKLILEPPKKKNSAFFGICLILPLKCIEISKQNCYRGLRGLRSRQVVAGRRSSPAVDAIEDEQIHGNVGEGAPSVLHGSRHHFTQGGAATVPSTKLKRKKNFSSFT